MLVGTRKGAFCSNQTVMVKSGKLTDHTLPAGRSIILRGRLGRFESHLRIADVELVSPSRCSAPMTAGEAGDRRQRLRLRRDAGHASVVRRNAPPLGVCARLAFRAVALQSPRHRLCGVEDAALFGSTDGGRTWEELASLREHPSASLETRRGWHVPAHNRHRSRETRPASLRRSRQPARFQRRRREDVAPDQSRPEIE